MKLIKINHKIWIAGITGLLIILAMTLFLLPTPKITFNHTFCGEGGFYENKYGFSCVRKWGYLSEWLYTTKLKLNFNEQDFASILTMGERIDNEQLVADAFDIAIDNQVPQSLIINYLLFYMSNHPDSSEHLFYLLKSIDYKNPDNQKAFILNYCRYYDNAPLDETHLVLTMKEVFLAQGLKIESLTCLESQSWRGNDDGTIPRLNE